MKTILRSLGIGILSIYIATQIAGGLEFTNYVEGVLITGIALGVSSFTLKPLVKLFLLPLTLATMGLFGFLANVFTLYIIDYALPQFKVTGFHFAGYSSSYFDLPKIDYNGFFAYFTFAILISILTSFINWVRK